MPDERDPMRFPPPLLTGLLLSLIVLGATARPLGARLGQARGNTGSETTIELPAGARIQRNLAYGSDPAQVMDVYLPAGAKNAPVIFMVHGGAWRVGDKGAANVVQNKVARWLPRGFIFVSINYRMLPAQAALQQADDVARALAFAQAQAASWGGDRDQFVLMGHSAGAHLVALLAAAPARASALGARRWLGTVSLDSAAIDIVAVMNRRHLPFYDQAFGADPARWQQASPMQMLARGATPLLAVCSSQRRDQPCTQAQAYVDKSNGLGARAALLPQDRTHAQINADLGEPGGYTDAVENFMASLDPGLAQRLGDRASR